MEKNDFIKVKEGLAEFYIYSEDQDSVPSKSMTVFYNKKMILNRDISSIALKAFYELYKQDLIIIDSMAASGISAIRFLKECKGIKKIYINDINPIAVDLIRKNLEFNNIDESLIKVLVSRKDANYLFSEITQMNSTAPDQERKIPNVISIDPFGTPNQYLNSAFNCIQKLNGLMCITATDTAVLHGVRPNACIQKYMSKSLHVEYNKEIGARILIYFASRIANINKIGVVPLLTFSSGHFIRVFLLTYKNKIRMAKNFKKYGYIIHCKCRYRTVIQDNIINIPRSCPLCNSSEDFDYAGPLWTGEIHDERFLNACLIKNEESHYHSQKKIDKLLKMAFEEIHMPISYYQIHKLTQKLKLYYVQKMDNILKMIKEKGFMASRTHFDPLSIKTNMDLLSIEQNLIKESKIK